MNRTRTAGLTISAILLGATVAGLLLAATGQLDPPRNFGAATEAPWLYHYQTLITGFLAVIAAAITVYFARLQIAQAQKQFMKQMEVSTYLTRREIDRETSNFAKPTSRLAKALREFSKSPTEPLWAAIQKEIATLTKRKSASGYARVREHMTGPQAGKASTFFIRANKVKAQQRVAGTQAFGSIDRNQINELLVSADAFLKILTEVRGASQGWLDDEVDD